MSELEECTEECRKKLEAKKQEEAKKAESFDKNGDGRPDDFIGKYNVITRIMAMVVTGVFIYAFVLPLDIAYAELIVYLMMAVMMVITFGINSLEIIGKIIDKWRK